MAAFWAVFLLCSQLTLSQGRGIIFPDAKADVDDFRDSQAKRDTQRLPRGLLGGNLLGGLLGKDGVLGGLLGENGAVGSVLGEDGVLGGLLGENGAVGSVLGEDGVLGGLLGENGAVGSLLGKDGVLSGLLGEDGVVNNLLDRDGILGGILGGLLDRDGILGGLLGNDGVLDGLLGKDGLVDGLLDAVLDILIGKNGILGKNGLVGNLLGGNDGDLAGPKILNNTLPRIRLRSLPGFGHEVGFSTQLLVETTSASGTGLCVPVDADVVMLVQDKWATQESDKDCMTVDMNIHVRPNVPLLDQPLKQVLSDSLREVGCNIVSARLGVLGALLGSRTPALPLGALGDLPPFSILSGDAVQLELNLLAGDTEGDIVTPTQGPPLAARLLLATGRVPRLSLPRRGLGLLLGLAQEQGAFNLIITDSMVPGTVSLSTSALLPLIPQLAKILRTSLPLELNVQVADEPVVTVSSQRATATLRASINVTVPTLQLPQKLLFSVDADIVVNIIPSVSDGKLWMSLALDSIKLTRTPRGLDPLSVSSLAEWLKQVLMAAYVPAVNNALHVSVPLPNILSTSLQSIEMDITEADNFPDQMALKGSCPGGPLALLAL